MSTTKSDRTRAQIIEGAVRALADVGVAAVTTRRIAEACGVRLATLHYHFESKSTLLQAVLEALIEEMTQALRDEIRDGADLDDGIERILRAAWRWVLRTRSLQIVQYELTLYALREGADGLAERQYDAYVGVYADLLARFPGGDGLDPQARGALAHFMLAGIDGMILQDLAKPDPVRSRRSLDDLVAACRRLAAGMVA